MKILVTGCSGLLGRRFIERHACDFEITALSRTPINTPVPGVTYCTTDYSSESLTVLFEGQDAVLHLAAARLYTGNECYQQNTQLDAAVFDAAQQAGVHHVVFASTRGVYGKATAPWIESQATAPENPYASGKVQSELLAEQYGRSGGLRITCLRLAQIFSAEEFKGSMLRTFFDLAAQGQPLPVTVSGILREYLYIDDAVDAFRTVIESDAEGGIYNLGSGESVSIEDIARAIADVYGVEVQLASELKLVEEFSLMDSSKLRTQFGWRPGFSFEQAVGDIANRNKRNV
ncbi:NAD-dependent epimerase/dehydratase family protein [Ferrimonas balearica]|uniref:NAD-dependent epimerase/dehydratase family protein n=1 Tax=Ferrimonas balearica TaxID=44012 RepID=UPI001C9636E7|nr:NAD(P)-dependent oxidoreductase [Ferrimonas balearica]MBY5978949.1 NAD(P)-dependent oxidoreductase [Ferrimonas balearica]